jgi:HCOMODA/2-hydroxy-3-carboxy-muconic semialdehyde decarboxylase
VRELVFRSVYGARNAELQLAAARLGAVVPLGAGEVAAAAECNLAPTVVARAWELWVVQAHAAHPIDPVHGASA